jgi:hypothetical protein
MTLQTALTMLEGLRPWTHAISTIALPYKVLLTIPCVGGLSARGPRRPPMSVVRHDHAALVDNVITQTIDTVLYFGLLTFLVILWDWRWIVAGYCMVQAVVLLADLVQVLTLVAAGAVWAVGGGPRGVIVTALSARLVSFAASAFYVAITFVAWRT